MGILLFHPTHEHDFKGGKDGQVPNAGSWPGPLRSTCTYSICKSCGPSPGDCPWRVEGARLLRQVLSPHDHPMLGVLSGPACIQPLGKFDSGRTPMSRHGVGTLYRLPTRRSQVSSGTKLCSQGWGKSRMRPYPWRINSHDEMTACLLRDDQVGPRIIPGRQKKQLLRHQ